MKRIIIFLILLSTSFLIVGAQIEPLIYYKLNLDYDKGMIKVNSTEIEFSDKNLENVFGFYVIEVLDYNNELLNLTFFDVPNEVLWDGINPETGEIDKGGVLELEQLSFNIYVPYYENAKEIIIYNENLNELTKKDISEYSKQKKEISGKIIEDEREEVESKERVTETKNFVGELSEYWWILLIILIILIIILFYSLGKKK